MKSKYVCKPVFCILLTFSFAMFLLNSICFQASVLEMRTPGKFFIQIQSVEFSEILKNITQNLQKTYSGSFASVYKPEIGEICAVKFSFDQVNHIIECLIAYVNRDY